LRLRFTPAVAAAFDENRFAIFFRATMSAVRSQKRRTRDAHAVRSSEIEVARKSVRPSRLKLQHNRGSCGDEKRKSTFFGLERDEGADVDRSRDNARNASPASRAHLT